MSGHSGKTTPGARLTVRVLTLLVILLPLAALPHAQARARLWVLQEPASLVEYDVATFAARPPVTVPRSLMGMPGEVRVNAGGQVLFAPSPTEEASDWDTPPGAGRAWLWNGRTARELGVERSAVGAPAAGASAKAVVVQQVFLSASGESLFWFENRFERRTSSREPPDSIRVAARIWQTDLAGARARPVADIPAGDWCECGTGVCSESCPEWEFWAPGGVAGGFFLLTRLVPGQLGTMYQETLLVRRLGSSWQPVTLPVPIEEPLDASADGSLLLAAVPDGACCGWDNVSRDRLLLVSGGRVTVLYDEFDRYGNQDYDISFYVSAARLAPGGRLLAYTIASTAAAGSDLRLSAEGKPDERQLRRIRSTMSALPAIDVVRLAAEPARHATIPRATLVGWISEQEMIVTQDGRLVVYDANGTKQRETGIRVRTSADAFLR